MEGLEAVEINYSQLERTLRIDSEFFFKHHIVFAEQMALRTTEAIGGSNGVVDVSDGNHFSISDSFQDEGVPYYRGQDVVGQFFIEQANPVYIPEEAYRKPYMTRSHLKTGDVLLSIIGTIGSSSLVSSDSRATCSCKLAILRPRSISPEYLAVFLKTSHGQSQIERYTRGAVQKGLLLEDLDQLSVPRFNEIEQKVVETVERIKATNEEQTRLYADAETLLLQALGLDNWQPPEPLTYTQNFADVFNNERLDAEYFQPQYSALRQELRTRFATKALGDLGQVLKGSPVPYYEDGTVSIIRSGDLTDISNDEGYLKTSPTEPIFALSPGDVLISSIGFGSIGKVQVFDKPGRYGTVSEVTVVRQTEVNSYFLTIFLRSPLGQMQIAQYITGATGQLHLYPRDVKKIIVPLIPSDVQLECEKLVLAGYAARARAKSLLETAKRAVEIAIEQDEAAGLALLESAGG